MINKHQLVTTVSDSTRHPRKHVEEIIEAFLERIIQNLSMGEKVNLTGFGMFEVRERKGRRGVNPRNPDEPMMIPSVRVAKFRAGKTLKDSVK